MSAKGRRRRQTILRVVAAALLSAAPRLAGATAPAPADSTPDTPVPLARPFIQYGVAFTTEFVANAGGLCHNATAPCILGSGGGVVFPRVGWRSLGHWYLGGAYEISKQDAGTLYRLPILQQLRAEARYYLIDGHIAAPFLEGALGIAGYGNEWTVDTYGPCASLALGVETQISRRTAVSATFAYRLIHFSGFTDESGTARDPGFSQLVGLNVLLEVRDPY